MSAAFPFPEPPISGESLIGFVARNADKHGVAAVRAAILPVGIDTLVPESLPTVHRGRAAEIARVFRAPEAEILLRTHPPVDIPGRPASFIDFFGAPIRSAYCEVIRRRVSPASLAVSAHHRAIWDLRVLSFCPESRETLIDRCPACAMGLGWRWTLEPAHCERCGADLHDYPQPRIECADVEALDFVVDLVHPDAARRAQAKAMAPAVFAGLDNGTLFEGAMAVACAITTEPDAPRAIMRRLKTLEDFRRITPEALATAGRAQLDWPKTYLRIADGMRVRAGERDGHWGVKKELAPLVYLARDAYLAPLLKDEIRRRNDENMASASVAFRRVERRASPDLITVGDARREYGINGHMLKRWRADKLVWFESDETAKLSIVFLRRDELAAIAAARDDRIAIVEVTDVLGVDHVGAHALAAEGMIAAIVRPAADLVAGPRFRRSSVDALRARLLALAASQPAGTKAYVRLSKAAKRAGVNPIPWAAIFRAVLAGDLRVHLHPGEGNLAFTTSVTVADVRDVSAIIRAAAGADLTGGDRMSCPEAAALLGKTEVGIAEFIGKGILPTNGGTRFKLDRDVVDEFKRTRILANEIAHRKGWRYRHVRAFLLERVSRRWRTPTRTSSWFGTGKKLARPSRKSSSATTTTATAPTRSYSSSRTATSCSIRSPARAGYDWRSDFGLWLRVSLADLSAIVGVESPEPCPISRPSLCARPIGRISSLDACANACAWTRRSKSRSHRCRRTTRGSRRRRRWWSRGRGIGWISSTSVAGFSGLTWRWISAVSGRLIAAGRTRQRWVSRSAGAAASPARRRWVRPSGHPTLTCRTPTGGRRAGGRPPRSK